jgi:hypothetical protein
MERVGERIWLMYFPYVWEGGTLKPVEIIPSVGEMRENDYGGESSQGS